MFNNTVSLVTAEATDALHLSLVDGPTNHKTVRSAIGGSGETYRFLIGHQPSKENAGITTQRSVVRLEITKASSASGKPITGYAQFILSFPQDGTIGSNDMERITAQLVDFLIEAGSPGTLPNLHSAGVAAVTSPVVDRLLAGEP